jgi:RNA polymerase sigma factor for flagellar operon FliA
MIESITKLFPICNYSYFMITNLPAYVRPSKSGSRSKKRGLGKGFCQSVGKTRREEELVQQHLPLVKSIVARIAITLPPHVDSEDLYSAGLLGLVNAIRQYNPKMGTAFATYARVRIRGAILDELRRMDWVPRSVHSKARKVQAVMQQVEQRKGEIPDEEDMAKAMKISVEEYRQLLDEIRPVSFVSLDAVMGNEEVDGTDPYESLPDESQENPVDGVSRRELTRLILERLQKLPETQRKVLALYYFEDLRLREIAEAFNLTESRICQIHVQAILNLKSYLESIGACQV